ncbi:hypothetical protein [Butyrivibrio sp. MB2005]|uniref:hypothetical protein n=1 Tax=Butyrivibrio sp. MB2005 TaxID=1280678 RepID=UPI00041CA9EA|nr:hypothetical protein [Butyrivibrio sp. MB2005]
MSFAMLFLAFAVLACIAVFYAKVLNYDIMEGTVMSVFTIITVMFFSGYLKNFNIGIIMLAVLAVIGIIVLITQRGKEDRSRNEFITPAFVVVIAVLLLNSILFFHDFIQHIDELHQWAMIVKYMLGKNTLPVPGDFIGDIRQKYGTSLFILFFEKFTGYNEAFMYVSASVLYWIGFMLPFHNCRWKEWKKCFLYAAVVYMSLYAFYFYGGKNLYVDLATAGWAAGITTWWISGHSLKDKKKLPVLIAGLIMVFFFKSYIGILMDLLIVMYVAGHEITEMVLGGKLRVSRKIGIIAALVTTAGCLLGYTVIVSLGLKRYETAIVKQITYAFIESIVGKPLSVNPAIKFYLITIVVILVICAEVRAFVYKNDKNSVIKSKVLLFGEIGSLFIYLTALFMAYLVVFSYEEAAEMAAVGRYFSIIGIFVVLIAWSSLVSDETGTEIKETIPIREGYMFFMLLIFCFAINNKYLSNMTAFGLEYITGYDDIEEVRSQIKEIQKTIGETDRVYFLDQEGDSEYPSNFAFYTFDKNVSNYNAEPWKFTEKGSMIRLALNKDLGVDALPQLLLNGNYSYLWVYDSDAYLDDALAEMFGGEQIYGAALYKVSFSDDGTASLKIACDFDD